MLTPSWLDGLALGDAVSAESVEGGYASKTFRVRTSLGRSAIVKTQTNLPSDLYAVEADGLDALRVPGGFAVPEVLRVAPDFIVLTDLGPSAPLLRDLLEKTPAARWPSSTSTPPTSSGITRTTTWASFPSGTRGPPTATPSSPSTA